ncbi:hypothetical protein BSL78_14335 [Apostichopus japonicus]|uniref:Uncharacterized protein n=1 Tax=Stichopus japonicus TaxID=307972 RepID=A0A2G8KLF2_STIJA|nr:hypothetical protein BSL78_14335 [Apostichopus japonicus]
MNIKKRLEDDKELNIHEENKVRAESDSESADIVEPSTLDLSMKTKSHREGDTDTKKRKLSYGSIQQKIRRLCNGQESRDGKTKDRQHVSRDQSRPAVIDDTTDDSGGSVSVATAPTSMNNQQQQQLTNSHLTQLLQRNDGMNIPGFPAFPTNPYFPCFMYAVPASGPVAGAHSGSSTLPMVPPGTYLLHIPPNGNYQQMTHMVARNWWS